MITSRRYWRGFVIALKPLQRKYRKYNRTVKLMNKIRKSNEKSPVLSKLLVTVKHILIED